MRKPITTQEAERIVCNGGVVWRGKLKYLLAPMDPVSCGKPRVESSGGSCAIDWFEFNHMGGFEVEAPGAEVTKGVTWTPDAPVEIAQSQWMTAGQALDWMASHIGEYLEDDANGTTWRIPCVHGEIIARHGDLVVTKLSLPVIYNRRFRVPVAKQAPPKLPGGCEWVRDCDQVVSVREPNPLLGDTYTMVLQSQKSRDICAALVQLWDQEHASK